MYSRLRRHRSFTGFGLLAALLLVFLLLTLRSQIVSATFERDPAQPLGNTITVNSTSDVANSSDGLCTLGEAITAANTDTASGVVAGECGAGGGGGADAIVLSGVVGTIILSSPLPSITSEMSFIGPGLSQLSISGGGVVRVFNITVGTGTVSFSGLTITNGRATMDVGGGIYNQNGANLNVSDSLVSSSFAVLGGGIANSSSGTLTITNSTLSNNTAGTAAAIYNGSGTLNIINSTISGNTAGQTPGSGNGGGLNTGNGTVNVTNSTMHNNFAFGGGGGIYNSGPGATINVTNSTITGNSAVAGGGGGINNNNGGTIKLLNTIIADNLSQSGSDLLGTFVSLGHNLLTNIVGNTGFTLGTNNPNGDLVGASFARVFAILGPLQNNSGPTQTRALLPGSPAIDAADNCVVLGSASGGCLASPVTTDQRGFSRQVNSKVDMGAFESRGFTLSATSGTPQSKPVNTIFDPLVVTVSGVGGDPVAGGLVNFISPTTGSTAIFATTTNGISESIGANGQATTRPTANGIAGGPYTVTASSVGVTSTASFTLTNNQAVSTTTVSSSANPSELTQNVTFTATVTSTGPPAGTVQFKIDSVNFGSPVTVSNGTATISTSSLTVGTHPVSAEYSGDANFLPSSGTLTNGQVVRPQPSLSINDVSVTEGDSGTKFVFFQITASAASNLSLSVDFATSNNTAVAPSDYLATSGNTTFLPGQTIKTFFVTVNSDLTVEPDETFTVTLSNPVNATLNRSQGTGTIQNDDVAGGFLKFSQSMLSVNESAGLLIAVVTRTNNTDNAVTVDYATSDAGASPICSSVNGLASARCDFTTARGTLQFAAGETQKQIIVLVNRDSFPEPNEFFTLNLSNPTNGAVLATPFTANLTITNSAAGPPANLIDDATVFVRQHYHDFLNREPDSGGLAFWTQQITSCGSDTTCIELKRINVSAAFFLSIEFQETGYLVERFYKTSYGDASGVSTLGGFHQIAVPIVRVNEFLPDTQAIGKGIVVGMAGWEAALENNKQLFAAAFVQRSRFATAFPTTLTPAQFVDQLFVNTGVTPTMQDRDAAIGEFGAATNTTDLAGRGRALRRVAENTTFTQNELNRAFVLMQFFGYMRRNPDDPQDLDYTGYDFWLSKLNQFNGNFLTADMVKAFIVSGEYRSRFGP